MIQTLSCLARYKLPFSEQMLFFFLKIYIKGQPKLSLSAFFGGGGRSDNIQRKLTTEILLLTISFSLFCRRLVSVIQCSLHYTSVSRHQSAVHCCFQDFQHFVNQKNFKCRQRDLNYLHYLHFYSSLCYLDNTRSVSHLTPSSHSVSCFMLLESGRIYLGQSKDNPRPNLF